MTTSYRTQRIFESLTGTPIDTLDTADASIHMNEPLALLQNRASSFLFCASLFFGHRYSNSPSD